MVIFPIVRDSFSDENSVSYTNKYNWDMLSIGLTTDQRENVVVVVFFPAAATNSAHQCRSSFSVFPFDPLFFREKRGNGGSAFLRPPTCHLNGFHLSSSCLSLSLCNSSLSSSVTACSTHIYRHIPPPQTRRNPRKTNYSYLLLQRRRRRVGTEKKKEIEFKLKTGPMLVPAAHTLRAVQ